MNMSVSISPELARFVEAEVESGRYASAGEVVSDAPRALERDRAASLAGLREAWEVGEASGDAGPLDFAALKVEARRRQDA